MGKIGEWEEGVLMAASVLQSLYDEPTTAATIIRELGLTSADCSELDDFDKENLRKIQEQSGGRLSLRGI